MKVRAEGFSFFPSFEVVCMLVGGGEKMVLLGFFFFFGPPFQPLPKLFEQQISMLLCFFLPHTCLLSLLARVHNLSSASISLTLTLVFKFGCRLTHSVYSSSPNVLSNHVLPLLWHCLFFLFIEPFSNTINTPSDSSHSPCYTLIHSQCMYRSPM